MKIGPVAGKELLWWPVPTLFLGILFLFIPSLRAQAVGDHYIGRYDPARTGTALHMGDFHPPLKRVRSLELEGRLLLTFEDYLLLGGCGSESPCSYTLYDLEGMEQWTKEIPTEASIFYPELCTPSYSDDRLLLCGSTEEVVMIRVSTGEVLWRDSTIGNSEGRDPIVSGNITFYHGESGIKAVTAETGEELWSIELQTAEAPLALVGQRLYVSSDDGRLILLNPVNGTIEWELNLFAASDLMATEGRVFLLKKAESPPPGFPVEIARIAAVDASGKLLWEKEHHLGYSFSLSQDHLYVFNRGEVRIFGGGCFPCLEARDPSNGSQLWEEGRFDSAALWPVSISGDVIVGNLLYTISDLGLMAWDAFDGRMIWYDPLLIKGRLSASQGRLFVSTGDSIHVYEPSHEIYFPHLADGGGQTTLLTLANPNMQETMATIEFSDDNGDPLDLEVVGRGKISELDLSIPPGGSAGIETVGTDDLKTGWIRVEADTELKGSSIFRYQRGDERFEAGVAAAETSNRRHSYFREVNGLKTAVALANPFPRDIRVRLEVFEDGRDNVFEELNIQLPAGSHRAFFVETGTTDFTGYLVATADNDYPFVMTILRTHKGLQLSSYP